MSRFEWTLLSNIAHAGDRFSPISKAQSILKQISDHASLKLSVELMSSIYSSFESFISSTADFRVMTTAEQCSLIHRNLHGVWGLHCLFTFREIGVFDDLANQNAVATIYAPVHVQWTKNLSQTLDPDVTLTKLMLVVLAFSSNSSTLVFDKTAGKDILRHGTYRLFGSQSVYVEMMWKYMLYRYGHGQSVRRFSNLIKTILNVVNLTCEIYSSNHLHQKMCEVVTEQTERSLAIGAHESVPLWGKSWCFCRSYCSWYLWEGINEASNWSDVLRFRRFESEDESSFQSRQHVSCSLLISRCWDSLPLSCWFLLTSMSGRSSLSFESIIFLCTYDTQVPRNEGNNQSYLGTSLSCLSSTSIVGA